VDEEESSVSPKNVLPKEVLSPKEVLPKIVPDQFENFENFDNTLEICSWLIERPSILQLANKMLDAKSSSPGIIPETFSNFSGNMSTRPSSEGSRTSPDIFSSDIIVDNVRII